ncbi:MAG TPA: hypothetical protein PKE55_02730 [Kiritimatiellia bacterium]|nr:hypothetical protein [Kiritimatiellia bacterium]
MPGRYLLGFRVWLGVVFSGLILWIPARGEEEVWGPHPPAEIRMMGLNHRPVRTFRDLPQSPLRDRLEELAPPARQAALDWLNRFSFPPEDLESLHADSEGGVFYVCSSPMMTGEEPEVGPSDPPVSGSSLPISPFPDSLKFSSRPGAPNTLFLDFEGYDVVNTAWNANTTFGRSVFKAKPFSTDTDLTTFSPAEQVAIRRIWERMAEDFSSFNINVTTVRPASFGRRTGRVLITSRVDRDGLFNPFGENAGGVAYVGVYNLSNYTYYHPAWVYHDNLSNREDYIAEAGSHEFGHNLDLSHDGRTDGQEYYGGHGTGDTSWGPIMGTGYNRNVSQWSKGDYYLANNTQDDMAIIAGYLGYRADDHGNNNAGATPLVVDADGRVRASTPETDPANVTNVNKGVIHALNDVDVFSFTAGAGAVKLHVNPWRSPVNTRGGNVDLRARLYDSAMTLLADNNPAGNTFATIDTTVGGGTYFLHVSAVGVGNPMSSSPSGYTDYASVGQYFITGQVAVASVAVRVESALDFGGVAVGGQRTRSFVLHNDFPQSLQVTNMILPAGFSGGWTGTLAALSSRDVPIVFAPASPGFFGSSLTVQTAGGGAAQVVPMSGTGTTNVYLAVTNPVGPVTVPFETVEFAVSGIAGSDLVGGLRWSNLLTSAVGSGGVTSQWALVIPELGVGTNDVVISATNRPLGSVLAFDAAADSAYTSGWLTGDNGGYGFHGWILQATGANAGHFRASLPGNTRLSLASPAWGLWANSGDTAVALRPLVHAMRPGDTLRLGFDNNWIATGSSVGISLLNAAGEWLFEFLFTGGGSTYRINDSILDRNSGVGYTDSGINLALTLTSESTYQLTVNATTLTGTLAARTDRRPTRFRAWNFSAGPGEDHNFYINDLTMTSAPPAVVSTSTSVRVIRTSSPPVFEVQPVSFTNTFGAVTNLTVAVGGEGPFSLAWLKDGAAIPGATNESLVFSPLLRSDAGWYRVVASNVFGVSTSQIASVTVLRADQSIDFPHPGNQVATSVVTLAATANSGLPVSFEVVGGPGYLEGADLGFTGSGEVRVAARQPGNDDWNAAVSVTNAVLVSTVSPWITWPQPVAAVYGTLLGPVQLNAEASVEGTFNFEPAAGALLNAGTNLLTAVFTPLDEELYGSASAEVLWVVTRAPQSIQFTLLGNQVVTSRVALSGSADSGLRVGFLVESGPAWIEEGELAFGEVGEVVLVVSQPGDTNWLAAVPVTNRFEVIPFVDSNNNGIPDEWEIFFFGSLDAVTGTSDFDGDGLLDWEEYIAGTDPTDPTQTLETRVEPVEAGGFVIQWQSATGRYYAVGRKQDLGEPFTFFTSGIPAIPPINVITDAPPLEPPWFYRVRVGLEP